MKKESQPFDKSQIDYRTLEVYPASAMSPRPTTNFTSQDEYLETDPVFLTTYDGQGSVLTTDRTAAFRAQSQITNRGKLPSELRQRSIDGASARNRP